MEIQLSSKLFLSVQPQKLRSATEPPPKILLASLCKLKVEEDPAAEEESTWWDVYTDEILPRLPAKYLLTLKIVSKNWYQIISSPSFVRLHLKMCNERRTRILIAKDNPWGLIEYNSDDGEMKQIPYSPSLQKTQYQILGSCDGLLCLLFWCSRRSIAIYNPSTGECFRVKIPYHQSHVDHVSCSWFGYHLQEYILVLVAGLLGEIKVYKFTHTLEVELVHSGLVASSSGSWERGSLLHGVVHWPAFNPRVGNVISTYHLGNNKYSEILPPSVRSDFGIGVVHGHLCAISVPWEKVCQFDFEMWVMKQYGVEQSWTKYANLKVKQLGVPSPVGLFSNGDLILDFNKARLVRYSFDHNEPVLLVSHKSKQRAIICAESLMSPRIFEGRGGLE